MRNLKLQNGDGEVLDITSKSLFFSNLSGFGYENDESYWRIENDYRILNKQPKQKDVEGTLIFNGESPYREYQDFLQFITKKPLTLLYAPYAEYDTYKRTVSISSMEKKELDTVGTLSIPMKLTPLTPWYREFEIRSYQTDFEFI